MRHKKWLALTILAGAFTSAAVLATTVGARTGANPIIIGLVANSSGTMSAYDDPPDNGVTLAIDDINAKGGVLGRPLKIAFFDEKTQPSLSATGATQVIGQGAVAVLASCDFDFGSPAAIVANSHHLVGMSTCAGDPKFGAQGIGPYGYSMANTTNFEGAALAMFAYNTMHWRNAYVITDTTIQYTKGIAKYTADVFQKLGGKIIGQDTMSNADQSISAQITRLKAVKPAPDFVILSSFNPGLAAAVKQVRAAGVTLPLIGGAGWDGTYWLTGIPKFSNAWHGALGFVNYKTPQYGQDNAIAQKYKARFHSFPPNAYFLTGYAAVQALAEAIKEAGSTDGTKINDKLTHLTNFQTALGPVTFTPTVHAPSTPEVIDKYVNGKELYVTAIRPPASLVPNPFK
jgi:branched-chain amino acid transport system substrate-binding protein